MAHIAAELRHSPGGAGIETLVPPGSDLGTVLPQFDDLRYPLLRLVDPYGETLFSRYQMAALLPELERLKADRNDDLLDQLLRLAQRCRDRPHSFLAFVGD